MQVKDEHPQNLSNRDIMFGYAGVYVWPRKCRNAERMQGSNNHQVVNTPCKRVFQSVEEGQLLADRDCAYVFLNASISAC